MTTTNAPVSETRLTLGVVIINYNYSRYVKQTIESVLAQTSPFDEMLIVDDGSTDNSLEIIEPYTSKFTLIRKENGGLMTATRAGIKKITTDYVYILDADDYIFPQFAERFRAHLLSNPTKLHCQLAGVDSDGKPLDTIFPSYPPDYDAERMKEDNEVIGFYICPPTSGNVYRRDYLQKLDLDSFDAKEPLDGVGALISPYFGPVVSIAEPLAYYRVHTTSFSAASKPTAEVLTKEVDRFRRRWQHACKLLGRDKPPFKGEPLFVLERRLMAAGLEGKSPGLSTVRAFQTAMAKTHFTRQHKVMLTIWSGLYLVPSASLRRYLVNSRRSAKERPKIVKNLLKILRRK